jgi:predicted nucleic acid-binding protein
MTIGAADRVFVDTNILVYANVASAPFHAEALQKLKDLWSAGVELWWSRQILREYLAALTKPQSFTVPVPASILISQMQQFHQKLTVAEDGPNVTSLLLHLFSTISMGGKQIHDANIVATMQAHQISNLLTHNTADFARFASIITIVPLVP